MIHSSTCVEGIVFHLANGETEAQKYQVAFWQGDTTEPRTQASEAPWQDWPGPLGGSLGPVFV